MITPNPDLRAELWEWLDNVVAWLNHEYVWDVSTMIPACWPRHPHLVHEIASWLTYDAAQDRP